MRVTGIFSTYIFGVGGRKDWLKDSYYYSYTIVLLHRTQITDIIVSLVFINNVMCILYYLLHVDQVLSGETGWYMHACNQGSTKLATWSMYVRQFSSMLINFVSLALTLARLYIHQIRNL